MPARDVATAQRHVQWFCQMTLKRVWPFAKAIYTPIPQSTPGEYLIDMDSCLNTPPNYMPCDRCFQACLPKAIDFSMAEEEIIERKVAIDYRLRWIRHDRSEKTKRIRLR